MEKFKAIIYIICIYFIMYFLQVNFFSWFNIYGVQPNLFVLLVLFLGIFIGGKIGATLGLVIGLYTDFLFSNSVGISAILLFCVGCSGAILEHRFCKDSKITIVIMSSITTALYEILMASYRAVFLSANLSFIPFLYILAIEIVFNALLIIIMYPLIHKFGLYVESIFGNKKLLTRYF